MSTVDDGNGKDEWKAINGIGRDMESARTIGKDDYYA